MIDIVAWYPLCVDLLRIIWNVFDLFVFSLIERFYAPGHRTKWRDEVRLNTEKNISTNQAIMPNKIDSLMHTNGEVSLISHFIYMVKTFLNSNIHFFSPLYSICFVQLYGYNSVHCMYCHSIGNRYYHGSSRFHSLYLSLSLYQLNFFHIQKLKSCFFFFKYYYYKRVAFQQLAIYSMRPLNPIASFNMT